MDNFDRNNVIKAALEVLHCTDLPFLLVIPDCTKLKTYSRTSAIDHAQERSAEYVTCRLNDDGRDKLACTFDDKPCLNRRYLTATASSAASALALKVLTAVSPFALSTSADVIITFMLSAKRTNMQETKYNVATVLNLR